MCGVSSIKKFAGQGFYKLGVLEMNPYMFVSCDQNAAEAHAVCVPKFRYLKMRVTNKNDVQRKLRDLLNSGNACDCHVQNPSSFLILSKNPNIKMHKAVILTVLLCGYEYILCKGESQIEAENKFLVVFAPKREKKVMTEEDCIMWSIMCWIWGLHNSDHSKLLSFGVRHHVSC